LKGQGLDSDSESVAFQRKAEVLKTKKNKRKENNEIIINKTTKLKINKSINK